MNPVGRTEADDAAFILRHAVYPAASGPVKGHLVAVAKKKVLAKVFAKALEEVAQMADQRKIPQHGVLFLRDVLYIKVDQRADEGKGKQDAQGNQQQVEHLKLPWC
jgi:hypothetical protein